METGLECGGTRRTILFFALATTIAVVAVKMSAGSTLHSSARILSTQTRPTTHLIGARALLNPQNRHLGPSNTADPSGNQKHLCA